MVAIRVLICFHSIVISNRVVTQMSFDCSTGSKTRRVLRTTADFRAGGAAAAQPLARLMFAR
jgi:hypothetical protein